MKRILLVLVLASFAAALFAQTAGARSVLPARYHARLTACHTSDDARSGSLEVDASVAPIRGTMRMGLRFELLGAPRPHGHFYRAPAPRLFVWRLSSPNKSPYEIDQTVAGLRAPAFYKMRVGFRWYSRHGRVLATRYLATRLCHQPDRRPDLQVTSVTPDPQNPTQYSAVLFNAGATDAGPFSSVMRSRGEIVGDPVTLSGLAAGASTTVAFTGPACKADTGPFVTVDSAEEVRESREGNNRTRASCAP